MQTNNVVGSGGAFNFSNLPKSFFDLQAKNIDGKLIDFSTFKNKKALIYTGWVDLHNKYKDKGFEVLGFPCNQFGKQEPKSEAEIKEFVKQFDVNFPLFSKIDVNGENTHLVYQFLKYNSSYFNKETNSLSDITWNFAKFLVDGKGQVKNSYMPKVAPADIEKDILSLLTE